jgi:argonaute-like protein implicated in RNA metabolism and viral defense
MFLKTLIELDRICKEQNIDYLLYKTHKYFDEVIGGDIDIIVKDEDFDRFLRVFSLL